MKKIFRALLFFLLLGAFFVFTGCGSASIGTVLKLTATVEAGPANALVVIGNSATLNSGDSVRVSGGHGRARLTLVDGTVIIELYDSTESSTGVAGAQQAIAFLSQGGLTTSVSKGSTCTVNVPNGGSFNILGTEAFIIYDPETQFATAGNFKGKVEFNSANMKGQPLEAGTMVDIGPDGMAYPPYPLPFGPEEFDRIVTEVGSPIDTIRILRDVYGIPQPGQQPEPETQGQALYTYEGENMVPGIAKEWSVDGSIDLGRETWTFFLSDGWRFDNGETLTAPFAAKFIMEKASPQALRGVEIFPADDFTLIIEFFKGSDLSLLQELPDILFDVQN
jgi:ABC-type transport system substrate-binding protein